jgi:hypothetical protein
MSYTQAGTCSKCGAPMFFPDSWFGLYPPQVQYSCMCNTAPIQVHTVVETKEQIKDNLDKRLFETQEAIFMAKSYEKLKKLYFEFQKELGDVCKGDRNKYTRLDVELMHMNGILAALRAIGGSITKEDEEKYGVK